MTTIFSFKLQLFCAFYLLACMLIIASLGAVSTILSGFYAPGLCGVTKVDQLLRIVNYICWAIIGQYQLQSKG